MIITVTAGVACSRHRKGLGRSGCSGLLEACCGCCILGRVGTPGAPQGLFHNWCRGGLSVLAPVLAAALRVHPALAQVLEGTVAGPWELFLRSERS